MSLEKMTAFYSFVSPSLRLISKYEMRFSHLFPHTFPSNGGEMNGIFVRTLHEHYH